MRFYGELGDQLATTATNLRVLGILLALSQLNTPQLPTQSDILVRSIAQINKLVWGIAT